ncbi:MAG: M13 family peptidase, partial [Crocinitomicaceae bacterium]|nr:M13 family peptidase [Crocinitomicaceae bacterium]
EAIKNYDDLAAFFGEANRYSVNCPIIFYVSEDLKDPTKYSVSSWQAGIGLPDREYYLNTDANSETIKTKYKAHIAKVLEMAKIESPTENATMIFDLEYKIASIQMKKEDTRDAAKLYNKYASKNLKKLMPDFNWSNYMNKAGFDKQKQVIISQVEYLKSLNDIIKNTPLENWKTYLKWSAIHANAKNLTQQLYTENFNFYGKVLSGAQEPVKLWKQGVDVVNDNLGELVGKVYVKKHFTPEAKERMKTLVQNLLNAYEESIKNLDWMSPKTKKEALTKLAKFTVKIGYPDKWKDYSKLAVKKDDFFGNIQRSSDFVYDEMLAKLGKPVDRTLWGMSPQTVNAYYNPSLNEIVFPAAILQAPFFDMNADDAVNYGAIGGVIGHEIGHGFDDQGATFDGDGKMRNWWTAKDLKSFKARTNALVAQYDSFKVFPDLNVNGEFTLGENIGDLGGLSIAIKAYKMSLNGKEAPKMDKFTGLQRVFIGWAQVWLNKDREEALRSQVASDPHSPSKFRINGVVRNIPEFYEAFDVKKTDSLYLAPEKRVKIW